MEPRQDTNRHSYWLALLLWASLILWLSSIPNREVLDPLHSINHSDKIEHAMACGLLTVLCYRALRSSNRVSIARNAGAFTILFVLAFGLMCEWNQMFVPSRSPDGWDLVANSFGSLFAMWAASFFMSPTHH